MYFKYRRLSKPSRNQNNRRVLILKRFVLIFSTTQKCILFRDTLVMFVHTPHVEFRLLKYINVHKFCLPNKSDLKFDRDMKYFFALVKCVF